jgi:hypothetical protein
MKTNENKMYALTYCYEGVDDNSPYAVTLAVSSDKQKLLDEMERCINEDCRISEDEDEDDLWEDDHNYSVWKGYGDEVYLQHNTRTNLYTSYKVHEVEVL